MGDPSGWGTPEGEPRTVWRVARVASFPRAVLLPRRHEDEDLPDLCVRTIPAWRRRFRQVLPRHGGQDCCWIHGGDWHVVSGLAVRLLREASSDGTEDDIELSSRMMIAARAEGWTGWAWEAFESLVYFPINVDADGYVNGRHRASAMMAAGVRKTVVQVLVPDG